MPVATLISYGLIRLHGLPLPDTVSMDVAKAVVLVAIVFFGAMLEEIGWATPRSRG
jgi:hypothetical protein